MKRREFLEKSGIAAGAAVLGSSALTGKAAEAKPLKNKKSAPKGKIKLGRYNITYEGIWYDGPALSFEEICKKAKDNGYDGVELDNKRPMGNPLDIDQKKRDEMRNILAKYGMEIPCIAANNDFSSPIPEHRSAQLLMVRETVKLAKDLGAPFVRLFAAWTGVPFHNGTGTYDFVRGEAYTFQDQFPYATWLERWKYVQESLREAARYADDSGIVLGLQNHPPLLRHWKDCYDMVKQVNAPSLKIMLDAPILEKIDNKEYVENAVRTVGNLQIHSHFGGEFERDEKGKPKLKTYYSNFDQPSPDYNHYIGLMNEFGYQGFFTFELCHPVLDNQFQPAKIDYVDSQVKMASEFMRDVINNPSM